MAVSLKPTIFKDEPKDDGSFTVYIRVGLNSKYAFIGTGYSVPKSGLNRKGKISSTEILDKCNVIIAGYRALIDSLPNLEGFTAQSIKSFILQGESLKEPLNYSKLFRRYLEKNEKSPSRSIYSAAYNHMKTFAGDNVLVNSITPGFLKKFEEYLSSRMGDRGVELYLSTVRLVYNDIMDEYEYLGYSFKYPFRKYSIPTSKPPEVKALTKKQLRAIIEVELEGLRANRSRDLFVMSLLALGTNATDFYQLEKLDTRITYKRSKTRKKRKDEAEISIKIQPELKPYLNKYKGGEKALIFSEWYANPPKVNEMLRLGLEQVKNQINTKHGEGFIDHLGYYDARRAISSVMTNILGISIDVVGRCLNHVDTDNKITWRYVEKDWSVIDKANRQFIDWLFDIGPYKPKPKSKKKA